jgi:hypothetical protein
MYVCMCVLIPFKNQLADFHGTLCMEDTLTPCLIYRGDDKSLARPTSRSIVFDGENISFDASLVIYINSTKIPPIVIINRVYEHQTLSL